jgi:hypothetical protein
MYAKRILFFIIASVVSTSAFAQARDSFCTALHDVIADAPHQFILTKGAEMDANETAIKWDCNIPVPGVLSARVVSAMGLFYEGALCQTTSIDEVKKVYDKYKMALTVCLVGDGYKLTTSDNFNKGLEDFRKLIYMLPATDSTQTPPPHVSMEVDYYKPTGVYTVILYVWEK